MNRNDEVLDALPRDIGRVGGVGSKREPLLLIYPYGHAMTEYGRAFGKGRRAEASHWGMHQVADFGFEASCYEDHPNRKRNILCRAIHRFLGLDVDHLFFNYDKLKVAKTIWSLGEREAVLALMARYFSRRRPVICCDAIWLLDEWSSINPIRRWIFRTLMGRLDAIGAISRATTDELRALIPKANVVPYRFGVPHRQIAALVDRSAPSPRNGAFELLMPGNDLRRDWRTAKDALATTPDVRLTMLSRHQWLADFVRDVANVDFVSGRDFGDLARHYGRCDAVMVVSKPNKHCAGLTTMLEAAALGIPLIVSRNPGMDEYLDDTMALFVPPEDPHALARAIEDLRSNPEATAERARAARARIVDEDMTSKAAVGRRCAMIRQAIAARVEA